MSEDNQLLGREAFIDYLEARLEEAGAIELLGREGFGLRLRVGRGEIQLGLEQVYTTYLQRPEMAREVADTLIKALQHHQGDRDLVSYEELRGRVLPMLKPITLLANVRERNLPMLAYRPFLADLIITYVIDEPGSVVYINEQHLERWQIDEASLHTRAIENLAAMTRERGSYTAAGAGAQRLIVFNSQDGFDATRLLLSPLLNEWRPQFPGHMVIGVPNRDFLICFSDADRAVLANVARQIQFDSAEREHGLTDQLFTLANGEVREYNWED